MKTTFQVVGGIILAGVLIVALMVFGFGVDMFGLELGKHIENKRTDVTRQTNQFKTTAQQTMATFAKEYRAAEEDGSEGQMKLIAEQMDLTAQTMNPDDLKASWISILVQEGYDY